MKRADANDLQALRFRVKAEAIARHRPNVIIFTGVRLVAKTTRNL